MAQVPDIELFLRFKKYRDKPASPAGREAFAEIVRRWQKPLINFFYRLCWNKDTAEDLTQEVFIRLVKAARAYKPRAKFNTFLYTIAKNLWIDKIRETGFRPVAVSLDNPIGEDKKITLGDIIPRGERPPDEIVITQETIKEIKQKMTNLSDDQRIILNLCVFEEMTYQEAAETLNIPLGSVKSRLHGALTRLKELIKS